MYIPQLPARQRLAARGSMPAGTMTGISVAIAVGVGLVALWLFFMVIRRLRKREAPPNLLPGNYMKNLWWKWTPRGGPKRNRSMTTTTTTATLVDPSPTADVALRNGPSSNAPQRGQSIRSIRSIITLPPYSRLPKEEEQVIAREGERSGMDLVVEFPETAEQEEERREEEMESLYQIRLRRREELAERGERRRQRQEARAAGDTDRLMQLSRASMASREANRGRPSASAMLVEHQARDRHHRIASVSYADIGHVRHDGSRIRANSNDSDSRPLLENSRHSTQSILTVRSQDRSSVSGVSTLNASIRSVDENTPDETDEGDLSTAQLPPPSYDYDDWGDAPAYESPITSTREQLWTDTLPQIRIDTASPNTTPAPQQLPGPHEHPTPHDRSL